MSALEKRLTVLEEITARQERQQMRELVKSLPEAYDLTPAEIEEATDDALKRMRGLRTG